MVDGGPSEELWCRCGFAFEDAFQSKLQRAGNWWSPWTIASRGILELDQWHDLGRNKKRPGHCPAVWALRYVTRRGADQAVAARRERTRNAEIRLEVAVSHHAFVGIEVDKNHRPVSEQPDFGNDGSLQRHVDGAYPHVLESEPGMRDLVLRWWRTMCVRAPCLTWREC